MANYAFLPSDLDPGPRRSGAICSYCLHWYPDFEWMVPNGHDCPTLRRIKGEVEEARVRVRREHLTDDERWMA